MAVFTKNGTINPFLIVELSKGDVIYAETDSMVAMQDGIEIKGELTGGLLSSLGRSLGSDENLFQQNITAMEDSMIMLSPQISGDIKIFQLDNKMGYFLNDYTYFASDKSVKLETKVNKNIGSIIFGGDGFFLLHASGQGNLVISGLGLIEEIQMSEDSGDFIVDNGHLLAWEDTISYKIEMIKSKSGIFNRVVNSITSSEGVVIRLSGTGKIYISSRKKIVDKSE